MPQRNTSPLTFEFCHSHRLVFQPRTGEEALLIQQRLRDYGIIWANSDSVGSKIQECVEKGMAVESGKLYYNPTQSPDNILCSADQFDRNYIPEDRRFILEQFNKLAGRLDDIVTRLEALEKKVDAMHAEVFPDLAGTKPLPRPRP